ncbi:MAG TPA: threonylcarbamoyl-AMP synthase [Gammaproteobacteria bacterium]|nr:threonylcarbamoyl-AMP synthase [Gammaproteobacteria bacterium]
MSQYFEIHHQNPQHRLIAQAVSIIDRGGIIVYPTDSCYALGCHLGDKAAMERIRRIRQVGKEHHFTLMCRDLSEISNYAKVDNDAFRLMKHLTPGPYTFILQATRDVPKRLQNPKRKTIGIRVPDNLIALALLETLNQPIMSSTLMLPDTDMPLTDPYQIRVLLEHEVDLVIDGGFCDIEPSTVVDMTSGRPEVLREGKGELSWLELH